MSPPNATADVVKVPGSISNLGPGFDALSVAVTTYLTARITAKDHAAQGVFECAFEGPVPAGENRIATAFERARQAFGPDTPALAVSVASEIPVRAGLGSSAAATIAGLLLYERVTAPRPATDWLRLATEIEGHPDNAAAALLGGLALSWQHDDGRVDAWSTPWPSDVCFVVATPHVELETKFARTVLPAEISRTDAVFNLQRALLFMRAVDRGQYHHLREALRDRWHQPHRQKFVPGLAEALALEHPSIFGVCLSGSGPSIALLTDHRHAEAAEALGAIYDRLGVPYTMKTLAAHAPVERQERS